MITRQYIVQSRHLVAADPFCPTDAQFLPALSGAEVRRGSHLRLARLRRIRATHVYKKCMPQILKGLLDLRFVGFLRDRPALQLALSHPFLCLRAHNTLLPN
jgi:hypothetical protein